MKDKLIFIVLLLIINTLKLNAIEDISINNYSLVPIFNKDTKIYNVFVEEEKEIISINAIPSEKEIITGLGSKSLKRGLNQIEIKSYVDNVETNSYIINITRGENLFDKESAYLKSLSVNGLNIDFQKEKLEYYIKSEEELQLDYEIYNPKEVVKITKENNVYSIKVTSEDKKNTTTYKIFVDKTISTNEETSKKSRVFDKEFSKSDLFIIKSIIIVLEMTTIIALFYFIVLKKRTNKVLYIKRSILRK